MGSLAADSLIIVQFKLKIDTAEKDFQWEKLLHKGKIDSTVNHKKIMKIAGLKSMGKMYSCTMYINA